MKKLGIIILVMILVLFMVSSCFLAKNNKDYLVLIGADKQEIKKCRGYDLVVIDGYYLDTATIRELKKANGRVYSYLNIGSLESFRSSYSQFKNLILSNYNNWDNEWWVKVSDSRWQDYIADQGKILRSKGLDGLFLDNTDIYDHYPSEEIYQGLVTMIRSLDRLGLPLLINGGDKFVRQAIAQDKLAKLIAGVNQECVFTRIDYKNHKFYASDKKTRSYFQKYLAMIKDQKLKVYLLEYGKNAKIEKEIRNYCQAEGFYYAISPNLELNKLY